MNATDVKQGLIGFQNDDYPASNNFALNLKVSANETLRWEPGFYTCGVDLTPPRSGIQRCHTAKLAIEVRLRLKACFQHNHRH